MEHTCLFRFKECNGDCRAQGATATFYCIHCKREITIPNKPWSWLNDYTEKYLFESSSST